MHRRVIAIIQQDVVGESLGCGWGQSRCQERECIRPVSCLINAQRAPCATPVAQHCLWAQVSELLVLHNAPRVKVLLNNGRDRRQGSADIMMCS